jgi:hypothetical protein
LLGAENAPSTLDDRDVWRIGRGAGGSRYSNGAGEVIDFNDHENTTKAQVKSLLRRAAKRFPED